MEAHFPKSASSGYHSGMGFDEIATSIGHQLAVVVQAPVPFIAAVLMAWFVIWRAMEWRYGGIVARYGKEVEFLEKSLVRAAPPIATQVTATDPSSTLSEAPSFTANAGTVSHEPVGKREFLPGEMTPKYIAKLRSDLTGLAADKMFDSYVGKWMKVSGTVYNTGLVDGDAYIHIVQDEADGIRETIQSQVSLWFGKDHASVEQVSVGDLIKAQGEVQNINNLGMILIKSELIA